MQPYLFPYLGYFYLMNSVDRWVVFDIVNYKKRSWMNRNRVLCERKGWQYISYPVQKATMGTKICDVMGNNSDSAKEKIIGQLGIYKKRAPYVHNVIEIVEETFARRISDRLVDVCVSGLNVVNERLGIDLELELLSEMELELPHIEHPGQWALEISKRLEADRYINPVGGKDIFKPEEFEEAGVELWFSDPKALVYNVKPFRFEPGLSILDVMSWLSFEEVNQALNDGGSLVQ